MSDSTNRFDDLVGVVLKVPKQYHDCVLELCADAGLSPRTTKELVWAQYQDLIRRGIVARYNELNGRLKRLDTAITELEAAGDNEIDVSSFGLGGEPGDLR